jgi:hypothetical protein
VGKIGPRVAATIVGIAFSVYLAKGQVGWIPDWTLLVISLAAGIYWLTYNDEIRSFITKCLWTQPGTLIHPSTGQPITGARAEKRGHCSPCRFGASGFSACWLSPLESAHSIEINGAGRHY